MCVRMRVRESPTFSIVPAMWCIVRFFGICECAERSDEEGRRGWRFIDGVCCAGDVLIVEGLWELLVASLGYKILEFFSTIVSC